MKLFATPIILFLAKIKAVVCFTTFTQTTVKMKATSGSFPLSTDLGVQWVSLIQLPLAH